MSRTRVLAILPGIIPSTVIGVVKPLTELHHRRNIDLRITMEPLVGAGDIARADVVVFCRNAEPVFEKTLDLLEAANKPFIYEIDDDLFELPPDTAEGRYFRVAERVAILERYLSSAALVRVYSKPMEERTRRLNPRVAHLVPPVDLSLIGTPPRGRPDERIRIVYATSRVNDRLASVFLPALRQIARDYRGQVEAHFWMSDATLAQTVEGAITHRYVRDYDRFLRRFSTAGFHIGLAPLLNDSFHRAKTNNKFREYGVSRIAGIYSHVDVYSECVRHEQTGLLVENSTASWYSALARLIEQPDLRERIRVQAHACVAEHYAQSRFEQVWLEHIERVLSARAVAAPPEPIARVVPAGIGRHSAGSSRPTPSIRWVYHCLRRVRARWRIHSDLMPLRVRRWRWLRSLATLTRLRGQLPRTVAERTSQSGDLVVVRSGEPGHSDCSEPEIRTCCTM